MNEIMEAEYEEIPQQMSDDELVAIVNARLANAHNGEGNELDVKTPLDYYYGRAPALENCKDPKASDIVSMDLHDAVEATVAEIMPAFGGGDIAQFEAETMEEEKQVKAEADICNYLLMERYNGMEVLTAGLKDCLLHRNAYAKVYWDTRKEVGYETWEQVSQEQIAQLMQPRVEGEVVEIASHEEVPPPIEIQQQYQQLQEQYQQSVVQAQMIGMPPQVQPPEPPPGYFTVSLKRITIKSGPVVLSVPPEDALIDPSLQCVDLDKSIFTAHRNYVMRSDLIAQGYDESIVEDLPGYSGKQITSSSRAGVEYSGSGASNNDATDYIEVYECYLNVDRDKDGIAELRRVIVSNDVLLDDEPWDATDMVAGAICTMPHQHHGVSMYDLQKPIQDAKTDLLRSTVDGAALASRQRIEATNDVNLDDLLTSTRGGIVRSKRIGSVAQLPNPEIPPSVYSTLEMMDKLRRERGGAAVDSSAQTMHIGGDSAHGIERVMSNIELTNAQVAKTFGETFVRGLFLRLHSLIRKYHRGEISAKIGGQWVSSSPSHWPQRDRVSINMGSSQGERLRMAGALQGIQAIQKEMLAQGMTTTTAEKLYESSVDMAEYLGVQHPEQYFVDPASEEGMQLAQQQQEQQQAMQQKQEQQEQFQMQLAQMQTEYQGQVAQAELGKAQAQMAKTQADAHIDRLQQQIDALKAGEESRLKQEQMNRDTAMNLLKLEQERQEQLDSEYQQNMEVAR